MAQVKAILIERVTKVVQRAHKNYEVDVYGSHSTNLCLHWSDIDLVVGAKDQESIKIGQRNPNSE